MSFWTTIKQRLELLREQANKNELLRSEMLEAAKASKTVPQSVLDDEQRYCTGELAQHFKLPELGAKSTAKNAGLTLIDIFKPGPDDLYTGGGFFGVLFELVGVIDAIDGNFFADEIDKMSPLEADAAYREVKGTLVVVDTVLGGLSAYLRRARERDLADYWLWRKQARNDTHQATEKFFSERYRRVEKEEQAFLCYSARRERLVALLSRLAKKAKEPIRA
jgi:hypothetical protein